MFNDINSDMTRAHDLTGIDVQFYSVNLCTSWLAHGLGVEQEEKSTYFNTLGGNNKYLLKRYGFNRKFTSLWFRN